MTTTNPVTIELRVTGIAPLKFVTPEISIRRYKSSANDSIYTASVEARIRFLELIGVKSGRVVPVSEPNSEPFLIMADKKRSGMCRFFLSNGETYYDVEGEITFLNYADRQETKRVNRLKGSKPVWGHRPYRQMEGTIEWKIIPSKGKKLTMLHQQVAKHVFDIFLEEKLGQL